MSRAPAWLLVIFTLGAAFGVACRTTTVPVPVGPERCNVPERPRTPDTYPRDCEGGESVCLTPAEAAELGAYLDAASEWMWTVVNSCPWVREDGH